jgi:hypothetical protein
MLRQKQMHHLKIGVGLFILGLGLAVLMLVCSPAKARVEVNYIEYAHDGPAVVKFTNREQVPVRCSSPNAWLFLDVPPRALQQSVILMPRSHTQLLVSPQYLETSTTVSVLCMPQYSKLRQRIEFLLGKAGINIVSTGFVVSVALPPR